ncbi:MAG: ABC transporter permease [Gemmatimonadaceae bacterium]
MIPHASTSPFGARTARSRWSSFGDTLSRDVRFALRMLKRHRGATTFAIAIVGLGIGASSTVFSLVDTLLLRPLPFDEAERLVWVANGESENLSAQTVQVGNLLDLKEQTRTLSDVAGFSPFYGSGDIPMTGDGAPERLTGVPVTQDFFSLLGVKPWLGRYFTTEESQFNGLGAVVLDHQFWRTRFSGDPHVVGRRITLDGSVTTIVGVLPPSFDFAATFTPGRRVDFFRPFPLNVETDRQGNTLAIIGRLAPSATLESAQADARLVEQHIDRVRDAGAKRNGFHPMLSTLQHRVTGRFEDATLALAGAVGFLMLLVCANLSNLLLVRASIRRREMALRTALGAIRCQLVRQLLVESTLLSFAGATVGLVLALGAARLVAQLEGTSIPLLRDVSINLTVLSFTVLLTIVTGVAFGLLPALQASNVTPHEALAEGGRGSSGRRGRLRRAIVGAQIAVVCVLLTGAGLLLRSLIRVLDVDMGFDSSNVMALRVDPSRSFVSLTQRNDYFDDVLRNTRAVPGVVAVGLTDALPLGDNFGWRRWTTQATDQAIDDRNAHQPLVRMVDEGYFEAMKIPLRAGRAFTADDDSTSEPVVIVSENLARVMWPGADPLGRVLRTSNVDRRVVGVAGGVRYFALDRDADLEMYMPIRQTGDYAVVDLVVRGTIAPEQIAAGVRAALEHVDSQLPVRDIRSLESLVDHAVFPRRFIVLLFSGFAGFGLILAALGIYAVISYSVDQQQKEMGIRLALGAAPAGLQSRVLFDTVRLVMAGVVVGLPTSWAVARLIRGLLFDVAAWDPLTLVGVFVVLLAVAVLAGYAPAQRATRIDPAVALRAE